MTAPSAEPPRLQIRLLADGDKLNKLKLRSADAALSTFLQHRCKTFDAENVAKTYVLIDSTETPTCRVRGFITIMIAEIKNELLTVDGLGDEYSHAYPAVRIARLAVDLRHQRANYGTDLISYCIALVVAEIMPKVGCRFITLDANKPAIGFYEKLGFKLIDTDANRAFETPVMFLDLARIGV